MREVYMRAGFTKKIELIAGVVRISRFFPGSAARLPLPKQQFPIHFKSFGFYFIDRPQIKL
jgi:hypothetical protein